MFAEDMSVFFDTEGFASVFTVQRLAPPANTVTGIFGASSRAGLEGYAIGAHRELRYPVGQPALHNGDELVHQVDGSTYKVRGEPDMQNDGSEFLALLSKVTP